MTRAWQDNAAEFGALTKQGKDVRLALLAACSVQKGKPGERADTADGPHKTTAAAFAAAAGTTAGRVLRHLAAWDRMAAAGHVAAAATLTPADVETFGEVGEEVQRAFADTLLTEPRSPVQPTTEEIKKSIAQDPRILSEIISNNPALGRQIYKSNERQVLRAMPHFGEEFYRRQEEEHTPEGRDRHLREKLSMIPLRMKSLIRASLALDQFPAETVDLALEQLDTLAEQVAMLRGRFDGTSTAEVDAALTAIAEAPVELPMSPEARVRVQA